MTLVARDRGRLQALCTELGGVEAVPLAADLTDRGALDEVGRRLQQEGPDVFINNAGVGVYGEFASTPLEPQLACIDLNDRALVALSHAWLSAARRRSRGAMLLVASTAGFFPLPYEAVYAASKAFVISFGEALAAEVRGTPLVVRTLCPGFTTTEFARRAGLPDAVVIGRAAEPDAVARAGIRALASRRTTVAVGLAMEMAATAAPLVPRGVAARLGAWWMRRGLLRPD